MDNRVLVRTLVVVVLSSTLLLFATGCHRQSLQGDGNVAYEGQDIGGGDPRVIASASATTRMGRAYENYINAQADAVRGGHAGYGTSMAPGYLPPDNVGSPGYVPSLSPVLPPGIPGRLLALGNESQWNVRITVESGTPGVIYDPVEVFLPVGAFTSVTVPAGWHYINAYSTSTHQNLRSNLRQIPDAGSENYRGLTFSSVWIHR